jgi:hypothetical protein
MGQRHGAARVSVMSAIEGSISEMRGPLRGGHVANFFDLRLTDGNRTRVK